MSGGLKYRALTFCSLLFVASLASAEERATVEAVGRTFGWLRALKFRDWQGELMTGVEWDRKDLSVGDGPRTKFERINFRERVRLANRGYWFHPNLLNFRLSGTFGLFQERFSAGDEDRDEDGELNGFDVDAILLQSMPYTLKVFANRSEDTAEREFAGTTEVTIGNTGAYLTLKETPLRSVVGFRREKLMEELRFGLGLDRREEVRHIASYEGIRLGEVSDLNVTYEFEDVDDRVNPVLDFQTHDALFYYRRFFGDYLEKDFQSRLRFFDRRGRFESVFVRADETLRIDHSDTLSSWYDYTLSYITVEDNQNLTHRGTTGVLHSFYGSLRSSLRANGTYSKIEGGRIFGYGGLGSLTYTKQIPLEGRFTAGAMGSYRIDDQKLPEGELFVFQERHRVDGFRRIFFEKPHVIRDTILVTNESGSIVFHEGFDYRITRIGDLTALERIPGGLLLDGQVILVDYRFVTSGVLDFSTLARAFNVNLDHDWIVLYADHRESDQRLLDGEDGRFLDDVTDRLAGFQLRWHSPRAQATLLAEYRSHDSKRVAYTSPSFAQTLSFRPSRTVTLNLNARTSFFDFAEPERETTNLLGRVDLAWRPGRYLYSNLFASYLQVDDTLAPDEKVIDAGVRMEFEIARLRILPTFVFTHREIGTSESTGYRAIVWVRRKIL